MIIGVSIIKGRCIGEDKAMFGARATKYENITKVPLT